MVQAQLISLVSKAVPDLREVNETAEVIARNAAARMVRGLSDAKKKSVRALTARAIAEGWSDEMLATRIASVVGLGERETRAIENYRAQLARDGVPKGIASQRVQEYRDRLRVMRARVIARTEVAQALAQAQRVLWAQQREDGEISPYAVRISRSHRDDRMCDTCRRNDGRRRSLKNTAGGPPYHPQCRCWEEISDQGHVEYVIKGDQIIKKEPIDGDGDGFVDDGKPTMRPAPPKAAKKMTSAVQAPKGTAAAKKMAAKKQTGAKKVAAKKPTPSFKALKEIAAKPAYQESWEIPFNWEAEAHAPNGGESKSYDASDAWDSGFDQDVFSLGEHADEAKPFEQMRVSSWMDSDAARKAAQLSDMADEEVDHKDILRARLKAVDEEMIRQRELLAPPDRKREAAAERARRGAGVEIRPVTDQKGSTVAQDFGEMYFMDNLDKGAVATKIQINDDLWARLKNAHSDEEIESLWQRYVDEHLDLEPVSEEAIHNEVLEHAVNKRNRAQMMYDFNLDKAEEMDDNWDAYLDTEIERVIRVTGASSDEELGVARTFAEGNLKREREQYVNDRIMWLGVVEKMDWLLNNATMENPEYAREFNDRFHTRNEKNQTQIDLATGHRQPSDTDAEGFLRTVLRKTIDTWAQSSGDHNPLSVAIQDIAEERYGIEGWKHGNVLGEHDSEEFWDQYGGDWAHGLYKHSRHGAHGEAIAMALDQMYENTQEALRAAGITELRMWRGMKLETRTKRQRDLDDDRYFPGDKVLEDLKDRITPEEGSAGPENPDDEFDFGTLYVPEHLGHTTIEDVELVSAPLASWTTHRPTAESFAGYTDYEGQVALIAEAVIPAARILGSAITGQGCLNEREFIVLGGSQRVTGHYVWKSDRGWVWEED